jgi:phosphoglycolate phosphatase
MNVLFDLDGTLTDPREGIIGCIRHAMQGLGRAVPPDAMLARFIGPPLLETFATLLGGEDADLVPQAVQLYRERFSERGIYENTLYAGIIPALAELRDRAFSLYITTSKPHVYARRIADHFRLRPYFDGIYGSELDGTRSAKAELVRHVLTVEGLDPAATSMVGDREHDMHAARGNGVRAIGVLWGYGTRGALQHAGASAICASPMKLPSLFDDRPCTRRSSRGAPE